MLGATKAAAAAHPQDWPDRRRRARNLEVELEWELEILSESGHLLEQEQFRHAHAMVLERAWLAQQLQLRLEPHQPARRCGHVLRHADPDNLGRHTPRVDVPAQPLQLRVKLAELVRLPLTRLLQLLLRPQCGHRLGVLLVELPLAPPLPLRLKQRAPIQRGIEEAGRRDGR
jgi:hypothetical protein